MRLVTCGQCNGSGKVRAGEKVGPIDWDYDFRRHFNSLCASDEARDRECALAVARLRAAVAALAAGKRLDVCSSGGYWFEVLDIGMFDGWPYWRPVPSVLRTETLGGTSWDTFGWLRFRDAETKEPIE